MGPEEISRAWSDVSLISDADRKPKPGPWCGVFVYETLGCLKGNRRKPPILGTPVPPKMARVFLCHPFLPLLNNICYFLPITMFIVPGGFCKWTPFTSLFHLFKNICYLVQKQSIYRYCCLFSRLKWKPLKHSRGIPSSICSRTCFVVPSWFKGNLSLLDFFYFFPGGLCKWKPLKHPLGVPPKDEAPISRAPRLRFIFVLLTLLSSLAAVLGYLVAARSPWDHEHSPASL